MIAPKSVAVVRLAGMGVGRGRELKLAGRI
jgi:hypothetical protein